MPPLAEIQLHIVLHKCLSHWPYPTCSINLFSACQVHKIMDTGRWSTRDQVRVDWQFIHHSLGYSVTSRRHIKHNFFINIRKMCQLTTEFCRSYTVWFSLTKTKMVKIEKITNSLTKTKTKMMKWWKLKRENRKRLKTKMPKQQNLSLNESASIQYGTYRCYGCTALTNGGRYLGRSSTRLHQQVWYYLVVGKTKTKK